MKVTLIHDVHTQVLTVPPARSVVYSRWAGPPQVPFGQADAADRIFVEAEVPIHAVQLASGERCHYALTDEANEALLPLVQHMRYLEARLAWFDNAGFWRRLRYLLLGP